MRVGALYAVLRLETGAFHAALAQSEGRFAAFAGVIKAAALATVQVLAGVAAGSLLMASSFEQHMNQSLAIMTNVSEDMRKRMEDAARAVAKTSTFSANEAADAYFYLAAAGYDAAQSIELLPVVTRFAQAGVMELEQATELLMDAQTTMGMRTDDATENMENMTRVSDVLAAAQLNSTATLQQMAEALTNKAGPALRVVGKDIEEGAAALMVLANRGVKGREAGTALAIVLRELQTKAIKNADAFRDFGIAVYDAEGNMRGLPDILGDMERAFEGLSDEQKKQALLTLGFTDRSVGFVQAVLGSSEEMRRFEEQLRSAGGTTEEVANKQLNTFQNQMTIMWHKIQDVAISIGQKLLPGATDMVKAIGNWVDANHELIASIAVGIFDAVGKVAGTLGNLIGVIGTAADLIGDTLGPAFAELEEMMEPVAFWVAAIVRNMDDLTKFAGHDSPLGRIGTIVLEASEAIETLADEVIPKLEAAFAWVEGQALPAVIEAFTWLGERVMPIFEAAARVIVEDVLPMLGDLFTWIGETAAPALAEAFSVIAEDVVPKLAEAFDWVAREVVPRIGSAIDWFSHNVLPFLQGVFVGVLDWVKDNWPTISSIISQVMGAVGTAFEVAADVIGAVVPVIWAIVEPIATVLFALVGEAAKLLLQAIEGSFTAIGAVFDTLGEAVKLVVDSIANTIGWLIDVFGGLNDVLTDVSDNIREFLGVAGQATVTAGTLRSGASGSFTYPAPTRTTSPTYYRTTPLSPTGVVPRFAIGTNWFAGGLAMVGEKGPELAYLPRGAGVLSNDRVMELLQGVGSGKIEKHNHVTVQGGLADVEKAEDVLVVLQRLDYLDSKKKGDG